MSATQAQDASATASLTESKAPTTAGHVHHGQSHSHAHAHAHPAPPNAGDEDEVTHDDINMNVDEMTVSQCIRRVFTIQSQRKETFNLFNYGFIEYKEDTCARGFDLYKRLVHEVTETFQGLSSHIMQVEKRLRELERADVAELIRQLQGFEKSHLELTAANQILGKKIADEGATDESTIQELDLKNKLRMVTQEIADVLEEMKYDLE